MILICSTSHSAASRVRIATPPLFSCCSVAFCTHTYFFMLHPFSTICTRRKVEEMWCLVMTQRDNVVYWKTQKEDH